MTRQELIDTAREAMLPATIAEVVLALIVASEAVAFAVLVNLVFGAPT